MHSDHNRATELLNLARVLQFFHQEQELKVQVLHIAPEIPRIMYYTKGGGGSILYFCGTELRDENDQGERATYTLDEWCEGW